MNYKQIYDNIIQNRQANPVEGYTENHHIIPKCLGGNDTKNNLVRLTAREHFICHYLLTKIYVKGTNEWYKMIHAFIPMNSSNGKQVRYMNSFLYESQRKYFSEVMSRTQLGEKNSQYGKMWISNIELKQNKKIYNYMEIPEGWIKGRNKWVIKKPKPKKPHYRPTLKWRPILENLSQKFEIYYKKVFSNKDFIIVALENKVPINQILWFLGCNNSGPNYKTIKNF